MNAYRESAALAPVVEVPRRGLVRKSGARCQCTPPGRIWCWWFHVEPGDMWLCKHGGEWARMSSYGTAKFNDFWTGSGGPS